MTKQDALDLSIHLHPSIQLYLSVDMYTFQNADALRGSIVAASPPMQQRKRARSARSFLSCRQAAAGRLVAALAPKVDEPWAALLAIAIPKEAK